MNLCNSRSLIILYLYSFFFFASKITLCTSDFRNRVKSHYKTLSLKFKLYTYTIQYLKLFLVPKYKDIAAK